MANDIFDKERAEALSYEDEVSSRRTVTIPLREYDELKEQQDFIKDPSLISIIIMSNFNSRHCIPYDF